MMSSKYKCQVCDRIPDDRQVLQCVNKHIMCIMCGLKCNLICTYDEKSMAVTTNPAFDTIPESIPTAPLPSIPHQPQSLEFESHQITTNDDTNKKCPYKLKGCKWTFSSITEIQLHIKECKYRPYSCIGSKLGVWNCDWSGTFCDMEDHLKTVHIQNRQPYNYWHNEHIPFQSGQNQQIINIIDAFNKKFIFFHSSKSDSPNVSFMIFLLGRKQDADKYLIDFELKQDLRKIKFVENCLCDTDNIEQLLDEERFIAIPKNVIERFTIGGNIHFRFIIKRKDIFEAEESSKEEHLKQHKATAEIVNHSKNYSNNKKSMSETLNMARDTLKSDTSSAANGNNITNESSGSNNKWKLTIPTTLLTPSTSAAASASNTVAAPPTSIPSSILSIVRSDPLYSRGIPDTFRNKPMRTPRSINGDGMASASNSYFQRTPNNRFLKKRYVKQGDFNKNDE